MSDFLIKYAASNTDTYHVKSNRDDTRVNHDSKDVPAFCDLNPFRSSAQIEVTRFLDIIFILGLERAQ